MKKILFVLVASILNLFVIIPFSFKRAFVDVAESYGLGIISQADAAGMMHKLLMWQHGLSILTWVILVITTILFFKHIFSKKDELVLDTTIGEPVNLDENPNVQIPANNSETSPVSISPKNDETNESGDVEPEDETKK